jgi:tryptophanyl-tRNA synthetase
MKRFLTWVKPTSDQLHLGNYFGAIQPIAKIANDPAHQDDEFFLFVADMHALTWLHDAAQLRQNTLEVVKAYIACGIDPERFLIYTPSAIAAHAQCSWVLSCITTMWFMGRMHAYKAQIDLGKEDQVNVGTFTYPILMAADILLYGAHFVPVGKDQKQHVEYARDIAQKFNHHYGEVFQLPEPYIVPHVATVPWLDGRKMSKSYNNYLWLFDGPELIRKKVFQIPTDALPIEAPKDPDACTLFAIFSLFLSDFEKDALRTRYRAWWLSYKEIKTELTACIVDFLRPIQERYAQLDDKSVIDLLQRHTTKATGIAQETLDRVYANVGFVLSP